MAETLLKRKDVPTELKWDLSLIYKTKEDLEADLNRFVEKAEKFVKTYKGNLTSPKTIDACIDELLEMFILEDRLGNYTSLAVSVDHTDSEAQKLDQRVMSIFGKWGSELSFVDSEILAQPIEVIEKAVEIATSNKSYLKKLLRRKPHMLHAEAEKAVAALGETLEAPYELYEQTKLADMKFDDFEVNGTKHPLGYSLYEDDYEYDRDTDVRRAAFTAFYGKLRQYMYTTAGEYGTCVRKEKILSELRGYDSVFDYLLFDQEVTREMYDRQIDLIMEHLAPHMRRYAKLIQKANGLEKMTYADLKIALDPDYDPKVTIEESKKYIKDALSPLGEDYVNMVEEAYRDRWVDFAKNEGKCTGGFCSSPYKKPSFILLSWNDRMSDVFTIAHELGHAGHFRHCGNAQPYCDTWVSTYFVEAPSTMNELMLAEHLKKSSDDKRFRRWVLASQISNTYYHNFVTHLLEAAYQREVYKLVDKGEGVSAETLNEIFLGVLTKFWGDAVEIPEGSELTWMRQPHYYMGLYSYCYSASLTISTQVMKRVQREGKPAVDDWMRTLDAGSTLDPAGLAKLAGVDITTDQPLLDTIEYIGSIIDEIEKLS